MVTGWFETQPGACIRFFFWGFSEGWKNAIIQTDLDFKY